MENPGSPSQSQTQSQAQQSAVKNARNLSIKEFFTNRLLRTRSFEGGAQLPRDETLSWFDEFKARMIKKSQANKASSSNQPGTSEELNDDLSEPGEGNTVRFASQSKSKHNQKDDHNASLVKDSCDTYLGKLVETDEDLSEASPDDYLQSSFKDIPDSRSELRARRFQRISCVEKPDFDTASINTIFNRRDSRYEKVSRKPLKLILSKLFYLLSRIISYLIPFNYNLPWKLIAIVNFAFVVVLIGLSSETNQNVKAFTFFNGLVTGLLIATFCFGVVLLSLLVRIFPTAAGSDTVTIKQQAKVNQVLDDSSKTLNLSSIAHDEHETTIDPTEHDSENFTLFEVLESENQGSLGGADANRSECLLDDDDYKGWMIEFVGDYELRNKADIKLKLIFVKIENRILQLCKPKNSHDAESTSFPVFVHRRTYDLSTAKKFSANLLLPKNVKNLQKWVWSKKYPIKLEFLIENEQPSKIIDSTQNVQLTLFAKSCREKEEWFRRFKRILDENKLAQGNANKRSSILSNASGGNEDKISGSVKNIPYRSPSPSLRRDFVQTSRSSHILGGSKHETVDDIEMMSSSPSNLIRTKSCELLHADQTSSAETNISSEAPDDINFVEGPDDSTLTRETAELFSQAIEYSNFIESRPTLIYREYIERVIDSGRDATPTSDWFNSLIGRIFFDVFSHNYWSVWFKRKIQRKLYRIRLPYFMETLTLTKIDLGTNAPQFLNVVSHSFDSFGLSIDFDMAYSGGLTMTFETKLNLLKIKSDNSTTNSSTITSSQPNVNSSATNTNGNQIPVVITNNQQAGEQVQKDAGSFCDISLENTNKDGYKSAFSSSGSARTSGESSDSCDSDSESSSDSSCDEADVDEISDWEDYGAEKTRQSIVRFVDRIASSRYFQHATENRYIKKKLQDISNCPLVLVVKIQSLNGVLTLNVPPPQTDRVWYGFKPNPELILKALPKMGDREVNLSHVTDWIERKLAEEFRKILVIPNMEDIVLPVLKSDHLSYVTTTK